MVGCAITSHHVGTPLPGVHAAGQAPGTAPPGRVLYVDDEDVNRLLMQALLDFRSGVDLQMAADGASGLAAARARPPDLVLLDMRLPDMTGLQVLQALRADPALAGVPCVAVSANALPDEIAAALRQGFDAYVTKPIMKDRLFAEVDRFLARRAG